MPAVRIGAAAVAISLGLVWPHGASAQTREEAVRAAREGRTDEAIAALNKLIAADEDQPAASFDLAVVLTWVDRPGDATAAFEKAGGAPPPEYVLAPVIRAYRDQQRFADAERWARDGVARFPENATLAVLLGLVLADQGHATEAIERLEPWAARRPDDAEIWLALGYASLQARERFQALLAYAKARRARPDDAEASRSMARILEELGGPFGAAELMSEVPLSTRAREAADLARWAATVAEPGKSRPADATDELLARFDALIREADERHDRDSSLHLRRDRVFVLHTGRRWAEVVAAVEALREDGDLPPPYVLVLEAEALLALRRPAEARRAFEELLRADPLDRGAKIGLFFALIEEEEFDAAFRVVDELAASQEPWIQPSPEMPSAPNDAWLDTQLLAARARSWAGMQAESWSRIEPLATGAPGDVDLHLASAEVAAARGWPHLSDDEVEIAASLDPDTKEVQLALAESAMRRRRWDEAHERVAELARQHPADAGVERAQRELELHDDFELFGEIRWRFERGGGDNSPGPGFDAVNRLYGPPIDDVLRVVTGWEYHEADVTEGEARRRRLGAGLQLALTDVTIEGLVWHNDGSLTKTGGQLSVGWEPTDHWSFAAGAEVFAADTPLRAVKNGITANSAGASVRYAWDESRWLSLGATGYDFSDGNDRASALLAFDQQIIDRPHFVVSLRPELYASENSDSNVPYFSPQRDLSATLTVEATQILWRRYERSFSHRLALTGGAYWQEGFGGDGIGSILYEQTWQGQSWASLSWGAQLGSAMYDGDRTNSVEVWLKGTLYF